MDGVVLSRRDDTDVGQRLGVIVRCPGASDPDPAPLADRQDEQSGEPLECRIVRRARRGHAYNHAAKELDTLVVEKAHIENAIELFAPEQARHVWGELVRVEHLGIVAAHAAGATGRFELPSAERGHGCGLL